MAEYSLEPKDVMKIETQHRSIRTKIPVPESIPILEKLMRTEPRSMRGQPPIIWNEANDFIVSDHWGNRWIDWSSSVLIANAGHGRKEIKNALREMLDQGLLATYVFPHAKRAELTQMLQMLAPDPENYVVFLLTTGSEAVENCIKLSKTYAREKYGAYKRYIISFENAFHGRTMGSQLAGGMEGLKNWMGEERDPTFVQVPFPDGFKNKDISFDLFLKTLDQKKITPETIAGVITESFQGVGPDFFPNDYAQQLQDFCHKFDIVLSFDEVQSGFGRTGKMFCYEHYDIHPDLIACGKGISSSLPLAAVIGRKDIMNLYAPGSMTSTHSGSPLAVTAAIANLKILQDNHLLQHVSAMEEILFARLQKIQLRYSEQLACLHGKGLVAGIQVMNPKSKAPDPETAVKINVACFEKGLLMFAPVGIAGECIKICPPLTISGNALKESIEVFGEAVNEVLGRK